MSGHVHKDVEPPRVYTYDELLTPWFQTFGYFANMMNKGYEDVERYFMERVKNDESIEIKGTYVRRREKSNKN